MKSDNPLVVSMIQGKKVMHLNECAPFAFAPGETIVMPASELMNIDFTEATAENPTQCTALEISSGFVQSTMEWLNGYFPKTDEGRWEWSKDNLLLLNNIGLQDSLNRLIRVLVENNYRRQMLAGNTTRELIASLMQTHARHFLLAVPWGLPSSIDGPPASFRCCGDACGTIRGFDSESAWHHSSGPVSGLF